MLDIDLQQQLNTQDLIEQNEDWIKSLIEFSTNLQATKVFQKTFKFIINPNQQTFSKSYNTKLIMSLKPNPPAIKLNYFYCLKGALHEGEVLNYVCIQKSCSNKGLICSVCKHDHPSHNVIPLKYLLTALNCQKQNRLTSQSFQTQLEQLEKLKNSFLYELKIVVQKFALQIQQLEERIIDQFKQKKTQLMNHIEISMKFNEIIEETMNNRMKDQQILEKDFRTLAGLVEGGTKDKGNGGNIKFNVDLNVLVKEYENSYKSYSKKINGFLETSELMINQLLDLNKSTSVEMPKTQFIIKPPVSSTEAVSYVFSPTFKPTNITLSNNNKTAECINKCSERFGLVDGVVMKKGSYIRFKIEKLKNWIGIGVAIRNNIVSKNYHFLYNAVGHGSFMLSGNGYSWSHSNAQNNLVTSGYNFVEGNVIRIQTNENELVFTNENEENKVYKLPILMNENQWKEACFCVNLTSPGDKVAIV